MILFIMENKKDKPVMATGQGYSDEGDMRLISQKVKVICIAGVFRNYPPEYLEGEYDNVYT